MSHDRQPGQHRATRYEQILMEENFALREQNEVL